jgi:hypothetical protein
LEWVSTALALFLSTTSKIVKSYDYRLYNYTYINVIKLLKARNKNNKYKALTPLVYIKKNLSSTRLEMGKISDFALWYSSPIFAKIGEVQRNLDSSENPIYSMV